MAFLRNRYHDHEPVWHAQSVLVVAILLQLVLPNRFVLGPGYILPLVELLLLAALSFTTPRERVFKSLSRRMNVLLIICIIGATNFYGLMLIAGDLLNAGHITNGRELILTAINIYLTNIIIFGLLYWEMDGGGPGARASALKHEHDFLFPQNQNVTAHEAWAPTFIDYLYLSSTNAMAFSPTDTMPLSRRAKMLMLAQATISLIAIALVAARAINILG